MPIRNEMVIGLHRTKGAFIFQDNGKLHQEVNTGRKVTGKKGDMKKTVETAIFVSTF